MTPENPKAKPAPEENEAAGPNPDLDAFFQRLPTNLHWPAPNDAAIAAAVEAIQRISGSGNSAAPDDPSAEGEASGAVCSACGQTVRIGTRFCGNCGVRIGEQPLHSSAAESGPAGSQSEPDASRSAQHHYHHHYHHFISTQQNGVPALAQPDVSAPQGRASSTNAPGSRAALAARQVAQDWAQACNTRHIDDLVELYSADATLIRSNVPPMRSTPSIREFLFATVEAGLGEVEMESLRTEIFGEIALDLGRCKMLVPVAMGKRREERGKYLLVMARQPAGNWKIVADCWSSDLSVSPSVPSDAVRKTPDAPVKKPR